MAWHACCWHNQQVAAAGLVGISHRLHHTFNSDITGKHQQPSVAAHCSTVALLYIRACPPECAAAAGQITDHHLPRCDGACGAHLRGLCLMTSRVHGTLTGHVIGSDGVSC